MALCCVGHSLLAQGDAKTSSTSSQGIKRAVIKPWADVIPTDCKADSGVFQVFRYDDKLFFEIPLSKLKREFLLVNRISKTPQIGYGGEESNELVVRWERKNDKILLRTESYVNVAADTLPIARAVHAANFAEVIAAFPIQCYSRDSAAVVIEVTSLYTTDVGIMSLGKGLRDQYKISSLSTDRSFIDYAHSYPTNLEVENVLSFNADAAPQNPEARTVSVGMHHSMVELPEKAMTPRLVDWRVGFFATYSTDYGLDVQKAEKRGFITRWRLEPKDSAAYFRGELVEPIKPITYYLDPATPMKWRPWLRKGIESWNSAFEKAGFKNAVRVLDPPDSTQDPEFCPEDARYSVIRYFPSPVENAYGPEVHDPRSGEILESDIGWFHNVMNLQTQWYFTQAIQDPRAHKLPLPDSLMGELVAVVAAHEFGHTIGFPHNMKASSSYPVDSLRSPSFTKVYGTAPSIMDYARYNYVAQPGDGASLLPKVGPYDNFAVNWGYRVLPNVHKTEDETDSLNTWILAQDTNPMLRYGQQQWITVDPTAQMEDLGDDAIKASGYGIQNLHRVMDYLLDATTTKGKDYDLLEEMYNQVLSQWRTEIMHVIENVGGVVGTYKNAGQSGVIFEEVPKERQRRCVQFAQENIFQLPRWVLNSDIVRRFEANGSTERLMRIQERALSGLLANDKLLRLMEYNAIDDRAYSVSELFSDVENGIFSELNGPSYDADAFRRNLQRSFVQELINKMSAPPPPPVSMNPRVHIFVPASVYKTDARAIARVELESLKKRLAKARTKDSVNKAHIADMMHMIDDALNPRKS